MACISLMSAPAANALSLPVMTMQPMPSSASKVSRAAESSLITCALSALSALGRLSLTIPTRPLVSTMMVSYAMPVLHLLGSGRG